MLLAFGSSEQPEPNVLPQNIVHLLGAVIPIDRFILTGIVILLTVALAALYRFTRFGLATRAASENEVVAMLSGLSPNALSMVNTLIASAHRRRHRDPGRVDHPARHRDAPAPDRSRAGRGAAGAVHLVRDRLRGWDRPRDHRLADPVRVEPVVVSRPRAASRSPASPSWSLHPDRALHVSPRLEASEPRRARRAPASRGPAAPSSGHDDGACRRHLRDRARRASVRLPGGADQHADRNGDGAVAGGDHRLRRPDLDPAADARRSGGVRDLSPGGQCRDRLSPRPRARRRRGTRARADHRGVGACASGA